jgi:hypothetical protein
MRIIWLGDEPGDMQWLHDVHGCPDGMACAVLFGNEDAPTRIKAWRTYNPDHRAPPDWTYASAA